MTAAEILAAHTREVADFPQPGVMFKDLTRLFRDPDAFALVLQDIADRWSGTVDVVAGIEARGFIIGAPLAQRMSLGFVPIRKAGKLPGETHSQTYDLEYGTATIEVTADAFATESGPRVLLVDDVLATGGTAAAACRLVESAGAQVVGIEVLLELGFLAGREQLPGREVRAILVD
ncbi:adenine phosphoribosyltransferase [Flexivirga caeni]|uniref:Adenine phosphoribosyltransferase n=2 Tax=Flexivirga caeni TaxID=2294115 RepID=A0A3M9MBC0_9MICO|nr:adenine phosphoribosyltransferase [Flexivirga caeni]RNI22846.1 adenine phosphoribosyltransferase [Flexivirga caeni]